MADLLTVKIVRPDRLMYEGEAASVVLVTYTGELGVWPSHAAEICALGDGVMRFTRSAEDGGETVGIVISGGYAEIANDTVLILADNAQAVNDIDPEHVREVRQEAAERLAELPEGDSRGAYFRDRIEWCDLLLAHAAQ